MDEVGGQMKIEINKEMYYLNTPCIVKAILENDEVLIETAIGELNVEEDYGYNDTNYYVEPVNRTIIVNKKYLTEDQVNFQDQANKILLDAEQTYSSLLYAAEQEAKEIKRKTEEDAREFNREANEDLKRLLLKTKKIKGLEDFIDYILGEVNFVAYHEKNWWRDNEFSYKLCTIEEFEEKYREDSDYGPRAYILSPNRWREKEEVHLLLNSYTDYSGSDKYILKFFKTEKQFRSFVDKGLDESKAIYDKAVLDSLKKFGFQHDLIPKFEEDRKRIAEKRRENEIKELENKLERLREGKCEAKKKKSKK